MRYVIVAESEDIPNSSRVSSSRFFTGISNNARSYCLGINVFVNDFVNALELLKGKRYEQN